MGVKLKTRQEKKEGKTTPKSPRVPTLNNKETYSEGLFRL